ncbi:hypothetical protein [Streptosporangium sandarakinum]|uniref:hypothetical protein n=1 Tax=Streptosporangium sandarakinum TaxID=1260955 RepID=UPI0037AA3010
MPEPLNSPTVPLLVTTDLPPDTDLTEFGRVVADAVRTLTCEEGVSHEGFLRGGVFWLDPPRPGGPGAAPVAAGELRFAALIGHLSVPGMRATAREVAARARKVITRAVAARYGDLGSPAAVLAIRAEDVGERTPPSAVVVATGGAAAEPAVTEPAVAVRAYA